MRYAAGLEYCGAAYSGWQRQRHAESIQAHVEAALSTIAAAPIQTTCAGRTDAGVHAGNQVIHFDTAAVRPDHAWLFGCNSQLPPDISMAWIKPVAADFHARFSALTRAYRYLIINRPARPGIMRQYVAWERRPLDVKQMSLAAQHLLGEHDFTSFRAVACQARSAVRRIHRLELKRSGALVELYIEANAFLQHMVRNIVGALLAVGAGRQPADWIRQALLARNRACAGITAPASGLSLVKVRYPPAYALPPSAGDVLSLLCSSGEWPDG